MNGLEESLQPPRIDVKGHDKEKGADPKKKKVELRQREKIFDDIHCYHKRDDSDRNLAEHI